MTKRGKQAVMRPDNPYQNASVNGWWINLLSMILPPRGVTMGKGIRDLG